MRQFTYILASRKNGTLYIGVTNNLRRRIEQHRNGESNFTRRYNVTRLVFFEQHPDRETARRRERTLKDWDRTWKVSLIESVNSGWNDLSGQIPFD